VKYALSLIFGLAAGAATAIVLLYFNPLTRSQQRSSSDADWALQYSLGAPDVWLSTHDARLDLPLVPKNVPQLWEAGIKGTFLAALPLVDAAGGVGAAGSRISVPSARTEPVRAGLFVDDYWLISVPGQGSVFVHAVNNQWPLLRDTVVRVDWLHREWKGPGEYRPTVGPEATGATVVGLTGRFANTRGRGREHLSLDTYDGSLARLSGQLMLDVPDAPL
jgi:hypothetical protein